jgi:type II secretory pathway component PulF
MPSFAALVVNGQGNRQWLSRQGASEAQVRAGLRAQALWPIRIRRTRGRRRLTGMKLPARDFIALLHQLELQLRAGVNADVALAQLLEDAPKGKVRDLLEHVHREVAQGSTIHTACRYFKNQFPPHVAAVIAAGEASACLPESLRALADHLSGADALRRTARRALIYPVTVLGASAALVAFLLGGVVPQFVEILESMQLELPLPTAVLLATSTWLQAHGTTLIVALAAAVCSGFWVLRSRHGRFLADALWLKLPVVGDLVRCLATARFAAQCRLLHDAGIPLLEALKTAAEATGNGILFDRLAQAREAVAVGRPLHAALPRDGAFPAFVIPALKAGETSGQLGPALRHVETYAADRARELTASALALLEPALLVFLASVVGGIVLSFLLPLLALMGGVNGG